MVTRPRSRGLRCSSSSKAAKPRRMFLDGSSRSTRTMTWSRGAGPQLLRAAPGARRGGHPLRRLDVQADGVVADVGHVTVRPQHAARAMVDPRAGQERLSGAQEVVGVALRLEADHVGRRQPLHDGGADARRDDLPQRRRRPGDVGEVADQRARPALPDEGRRQVQVVVVQHDARLRVVAGLGQRGAREGLVDGDVAVVPGAQRGGVDHRPAWAAPTSGAAGTRAADWRSRRRRRRTSVARPA